MQILVAYDVMTETAEGKKRLRNVAQVCKNYGQRVQKSVFECVVDDMQYESLIQKLLKCIDEREDDLRIYRLREPKEQFVKCYGVSKILDFDSPLVV
jgi:CRISPR-associated protein Cas2